jgi:hypothetical protein
MVKTMLLPLGRDDFLAPSLVRLLLVADFIGTSLGSLHQDKASGPTCNKFQGNSDEGLKGSRGGWAISFSIFNAEALSSLTST